MGMTDTPYKVKLHPCSEFYSQILTLCAEHDLVAQQYADLVELVL